MGGFHVYDGNEPYCPLLLEDVVQLIRAGLIVLPSEEEIQDRSKSDWVAKSIVLVHTSWFVMQCVARHFEHLSITELEIATAAYTILIVLIYISWWSKPLGVAQPIRVPKHVYTPPLPSDYMEPHDSSVGSLAAKLGKLIPINLVKPAHSNRFVRPQQPEENLQDLSLHKWFPHESPSYRQPQQDDASRLSS